MPELNKGFGFIKDVHDSRDYNTREFFAAPKPFDWDKGFDIEEDLKVLLPVNDQGSSFSCVGQAKSKDREVKEQLDLGRYYLMSARSIYSLRMNKPGLGMQLRDACEIERIPGVARRNDVADFQTESEMNSDEGVVIAPKTKSLTYLTFNFWGDIDGLAAHIRDYKGAMIAFDGLNNGTFFNEHPTLPNSQGQAQWGHAVYAGKVKLVNGEKRVYFLNSWGKGAGINGWQYFTEEDIKNRPSGYNPFYQGRVTIDLISNTAKLMADQFLIDNEGKLIQMTGPGATGEFGTVVNGVVRTGTSADVIATYLARKEGKGVPVEMWKLFPTKPVNQS